MGQQSVFLSNVFSYKQSSIRQDIFHSGLNSGLVWSKEKIT